jgi:hypothetical protein
MEIFKKEGFKLLTKGLGAKLLVSGGYSIVFFLGMHHFGKLFAIELSE